MDHQAVGTVQLTCNSGKAGNVYFESSNNATATNLMKKTLLTLLLLAFSACVLVPDTYAGQGSAPTAAKSKAGKNAKTMKKAEKKAKKKSA